MIPLYLFYELFLEDKNKGVIAYSKEENGEFSKPQIAIEETFHLSFPCIFNIGNDIYMIPETGSQHNIILYKCEYFPNKWYQVRILQYNIDSSDTIVWHADDGLYVLASILQGSTRNIQNYLFKLDTESLTLKLLSKQKACGERGYRNAGLLFTDGGKQFRPGQNCEDGQYGKSTIIWKVEENSKNYSERFYKDITIDDIVLLHKQSFCGVHTYNISKNYEVIDLKLLTSNRLCNRIFNILSVVKHKLLRS